MLVGDLVEYQDKVWKVYKAIRDVRTLILIHIDGSKVEVADDDPEMSFVASPTKNWPFVALPRKAEKSGPIIQIQRPVRNRPHVLRPNLDWTSSDPGRAGGSVFFNPDLKLRIGEVLVATFRNGSLGRVPITKTFGSIAQKRQRAEQEPENTTLFGRLLDDD